MSLPKPKAGLVRGWTSGAVSGGDIADGAVASLTADADGVALVIQVLGYKEWYCYLICSAVKIVFAQLFAPTVVEVVGKL